VTGVSRWTVCVVASSVLAVSVFASTRLATASPSVRTTTTALVTGRQLYREFCGKCHALSAALAAGFGSQKGYGTLGGPSFNELRIPYAYSITAVTEPTGGHELVRRKITPSQLIKVSTFIAKVTRDNPVPALPTDG